MKSSKQIAINAVWDDEAGVWIASSDDVPGLVVEADTWPRLLEEIGLVLPDMIKLNGLERDASEVTVRVESHVTLTAA